MFHEESVWPEIKSVISHYILERRGRQRDTLHAYLYGLIRKLTRESKSLQLTSSVIFNTLRSELDGKDIPSRPYSISTEKYGTITQKQVTKILIENFGADKPNHHGNANSLIFNNEILERLKMTYEVSIDIEAKVGIDGDDKYGMDVFVEDNHNHSTSSNETNTSTGSTDNNNDISNPSPNESVKPENNSVNGIDGIDGDDVGHRIDDKDIDSSDATSHPESSGDDWNDGIDNSVNNDHHNEIGSSDRHTADGNTDQSSSSSSSSSVDVDNIQLETDKTEQYFTNTNNQKRSAVTNTPTSINNISSHTKNLSHLSHLSHTSQSSTTDLTREIVAEFFYDDGLPYRPPPPHTLDESPCKSIIRMDDHSFYYCTLHPEVRNIHLESIEHHIKYKYPEMHKSEILNISNFVHKLAE